MKSRSRRNKREHGRELRCVCVCVVCGVCAPLYVIVVAAPRSAESRRRSGRRCVRLAQCEGDKGEGCVFSRPLKVYSRTASSRSHQDVAKIRPHWAHHGHGQHAERGPGSHAQRRHLDRFARPRSTPIQVRHRAPPRNTKCACGRTLTDHRSHSLTHSRGLGLG